MLDIILLAALTIFIFSKLFKSLGDTKYDNERSEVREELWNIQKTAKKPKEDERTQKIEIASALEAELDEKDREVFEHIRKKYEHSFTADKFIKGAKDAFEMIVKNFNEGSVGVLNELLSTDLLKTFEAEITRRKAANQKHEVTIVSIKEAKILKITNIHEYITVKVKFITEQIIVIKDAKSAKTIDGNDKKIRMLSDTWTFAKDMKAKSKVWRLVAVHDEQDESHH